MYEHTHGISVEELVMQKELQTKIASAREFLKLGTSPKNIAFALKFPLKQVLEIQAQLSES